MKKIYHPKIVLTSSWKSGFVSPGDERNTPQIKHLEELLAKEGLCIEDACPTLRGRSRDKEIERYLYFHDELYIIIDDDKNEYEKILSHTYLVNAKTGFCKGDVKSAYRMVAVCSLGIFICIQQC